MTPVVKTVLLASVLGLGMGLAVGDAFSPGSILTSSLPLHVTSLLMLLNFPALIGAVLISGNIHELSNVATGVCAFAQWATISVIVGRRIFRNNRHAG